MSKRAGPPIATGELTPAARTSAEVLAPGVEKTLAAPKATKRCG